MINNILQAILKFILQFCIVIHNSKHKLEIVIQTIYRILIFVLNLINLNKYKKKKNYLQTKNQLNLADFVFYRNKTSLSNFFIAKSYQIHIGKLKFYEYDILI